RTPRGKHPPRVSDSSQVTSSEYLLGLRLRGVENLAQLAQPVRDRLLRHAEQQRDFVLRHLLDGPLDDQFLESRRHLFEQQSCLGRGRRRGGIGHFGQGQEAAAICPQ